MLLEASMLLPAAAYLSCPLRRWACQPDLSATIVNIVAKIMIKTTVEECKEVKEANRKRSGMRECGPVNRAFFGGLIVVSVGAWGSVVVKALCY
jgi:hypothetical protein